MAHATAHRTRPASDMMSPGTGKAAAGTAASKEPCLARLQAQVDLRLGCSRCTQRQNESTYLLRAVEHECLQEILLARQKGMVPNSPWRKVDRRPSFPRPARYEVCRYYKPGLGCRRHRNQCTFARSPEEALVWTWEREFGVPRSCLKAALQGDMAQGSPGDAILAEFGGLFQLLCTYCFRRCPPRLSFVNAKGLCDAHGACPALLVHVSGEGHAKQQVVEVRAQPQHGQSLAYCMYVDRGLPCRHGAARCHFAHSAVEMAVWQAERLSGLRRGSLLAPPKQVPSVQLYCPACLVTCDSCEAFENHCASLEHRQMVALEPTATWEHRSPPTGLATFELCPRPELCEYGRLCTKAHSPEELVEWTQRAERVRLREEGAWKEGLVPYQARLLDEYQRSGNEVLVLAEIVKGVSATCDQPLLLRAADKVTQHSWTFTLSSEEPLEHVALLRQEPGATFSLEVPGLPPGQQYARGERFRVTTAPLQARVTVQVLSASFGTFEQWVVFDFGGRPALLRKLTVQLGREHRLDPPGPPAPGPTQPLERWHTGNRHIVPSVERTAEQAALLAKYKGPDLALDFSRGGPAPGPVTCANYRQRMHQFLYEEETAQQQLVAKLNLRGPVSLQLALQTPALGMLFPPLGALYAEVPVPHSLSPDTDQGFLLGRAVNTALVAPVPAPDLTVYEVRLESRASWERVLWLLLPAHCCQALGLQADTSRILEVQFQVDPLVFRRWHQAVDALANERLVVPDLQACALPRPLPTPPTMYGNRKQKQAVAAIMGEHPGGPEPMAPLLIYGPFGTGKTYTLAMASLEVVKRPHTRVLICTHTNSAADIYIQEHFHSHVSSGHPEATPLRVMYTDRPPSQTDAVTLQYCCLSADRQAFRHPSSDELRKHRIVVTTTAQARELPVLAGFFSHIFIDEAAQMLECEALMPLGHAGANTRVVLAGDHMQVTPRLFSVARDRAAGHTLLHRLFRHYQQQPHKAAEQSRIVFNENYRSTDVIINFVARHFYALANSSPIHASGKVPRHPRFYPLMFCHVAGSPERDLSMTSWLNPAEISQVVEKVQEILGAWPHCWGSCEQRQICVVSHGAQVSALRQELRKRNLGQVSVGSFEILPGREFRVVVLSTVHTRHSLQRLGSPSPDFFTDARVLNTVLTRAQSQVVAVGDAVALCSLGACSKLWKSFIRECVEHSSVCPPDLSLEQIEVSVAFQRRWAHGSLDAPTPQGAASDHAAEGAACPRDATRDGPAQKAEAEPVAAAQVVPAERVGKAVGNGEPADPGGAEEAESDFWLFEGELDPTDSILQELLDESLKMAVTVREDGLLDTVPRPTFPQQARQYVNLPRDKLCSLLREMPRLYRRCTFVQETFERATAIPLDEAGSGPFQVRGRLHCGMAFTGDEVVVKVSDTGSRDRGALERPQGRVVGVLRRRQRELVFVCRMDDWDPCIMIPIDGSVTKIFVAELKDPQNVPVHRLARGRLQRVGTECLSHSARRRRLFRVCVVLWRERFYYPLGVVLEVLPEASTWEHGTRALALEYGLKAPSLESAAISRALQRYRAELGRVSARRQDCRSFLTFTVDPHDAYNLDDAISVRDLDSRYEVAVHITDVASCVPRDSVLDIEARQRGTSFYTPDQEPVPMLPASLCQDMLSLLPGQDRLAISLFLTVEKRGDQLKNVHFAPSLVCSDQQLSYEEAEQLIQQHPGAGLELPANLDSMAACVAAACHFSQVLRRRRLQRACCYEPLDEDSALGSRMAHTMVKEYMIQFNSLVAEFLVDSKATRESTPLRWQPTPSRHQLEVLSEKHAAWVPLSLQLAPRVSNHSPPAAQMPLLAALWSRVQLAAQAQDLSLLADLISTDDLHPMLAPVTLDFHRALGRSTFCCSGSGPQSLGHYSLKVDWYTWATSPIRRYLDLVLQRQLLHVLDCRGMVYSAQDISGLCQEFSHQYARAQTYQRRAQSLYLATRLRAQPWDKLGFVVDMETGARCFKLLFPTNPDSLPDPCPVFYRSLQLAEPPRSLEGRPGLRLTWRRRIYSVWDDTACLPPHGALRDPYRRPVDSGLWRQLLELVQGQRWSEAAALVREQGAKEPGLPDLGLVRLSPCRLFVEVSRDLCPGDVLRVQLSPTLQRGFLAPALQLWTVAPGLSLCMEHVDQPGLCFSDHELQMGRDRCRDVAEYVSVWRPFCTLEAVTSAVIENESITLQGVNISWNRERTVQGQLQGSFLLDPAFLFQKCINISFSRCYLCIRLEGLQAAQPPARPSLAPAFTIDPDTFTWVAHGLTTGTEEQEGHAGSASGRYVPFFIQHMTMEKVPEQVLQPGARFTIEVLAQQLPDIRKEEAVCGLEGASKLVISIALGQPLLLPRQQLQAGGVPSRFLVQKVFDIPHSRHKLNPSQTKAVQEALKKQFMVIQGPPGTGKTVVALHIVFWLHKSNKERALLRSSTSREKALGVPHILYCGPSNKSVDVLAGLLLSRAEELKPLRVYSEQAEGTEFPMPGVGSRGMSRKGPGEGRPNQDLRSISLHHRIRQPSNPHSSAIKAFDARLQNGDILSSEELVVYRAALSRARKFELVRHHVILCTCSCSASPSLVKHLNVWQVLVDEAGMATEPETLIPLVNFPKIEKVVLLGDHKQLRPVVKNEQLQALGLDRSLFERYHKDAFMLDTQYRMHKGICAFPSMEFYNKQLKTWQGLRRQPSVLGHPGRGSCPVIFGYVQGQEQSLLVSTDEGNENSKTNLEEVDKVVHIAKQLILGGTVAPHEIAILTPYNAQAAEISRRLSLKGFRGVTVSSITKSQGSEWRYVLVSTVRSCPEADMDQRPTKGWLKKFLGFVVDPNQVNVAITRAQEGLCLIGNHLLLRCCPLWRRLLDFCEAEHSLVPATQIRVRRTPAAPF